MALKTIPNLPYLLKCCLLLALCLGIMTPPEGNAENIGADATATPNAKAVLNDGTIRLTYKAGLSGTVSGAINQRLLPGEDGQPVWANPDAGYVLSAWSDGVTENPRTDLNVQDTIDVTAEFEMDLGTKPVTRLSFLDEFSVYKSLQIEATGEQSWLAVWDNNRDVYYALSDDNGIHWTTPVSLSSEIPSGNNEKPILSASGKGSFIVNWYNYYEGNFFSRSTDGGQTWSNPQSSILGYLCAIESAGKGDWLALHRNSSWSWDDELSLARSDDDGSTWTAINFIDLDLVDYASREFVNHDLSTDGQGNWVAVWVSNNVFSENSHDRNSVLVSYSNDDGLTWSTPELISVVIMSESDYADQYPEHYRPKVENDGKGNWVIAWEATDYWWAGKDLDIYVSHSSDTGHHWSTPQPLYFDHTYEAYADAEMRLVTDHYGNWSIIWVRAKNEYYSQNKYKQDNVFIARSFDQGIHWSIPEPLLAWDEYVFDADDYISYNPYKNGTTLAQDGSGNWGLAFLGHLVQDEGNDYYYFFQSLEMPIFSLNYQASDGGAIVGTVVQRVSRGASSESIEALPDAGYRFQQWSDGRIDNPRVDDDVSTDLLVTALFAPGDYAVLYTSNGHGSFDGPTTQTVTHGHAGQAVSAIPDPGYRFTQWSDGLFDNPRNETTVTQDLNLEALFEYKLVATEPTPFIPESLNSYYYDICSDHHGNWVYFETNPWQPNQSLLYYSTDDGNTWSDAFEIADVGKYPQDPAIATDGNGNWVVTWSSYDENDYFRTIRAAYSHDNGQHWSEAVQLNVYTDEDYYAGSEYYPTVQAGSAGNWIIAWESNALINEDYSLGIDLDILMVTSSDEGETWSAPKPLNNNAENDNDELTSSPRTIDEQVDIASDGKGNMVAIWVSGIETSNIYQGSRDIVVACSNDNGKSWSDPAELDTFGTQVRFGWDYAMPAIVTDGKGQWVAMWSGVRGQSGTTGFDADIFAAYSTDNGSTWSPSAPLSIDPVLDAKEHWFWDLATDGNGNWFATWYVEGSTVNDYGLNSDVYVSRSTDGGRSWSYEQAPAIYLSEQGYNNHIPCIQPGLDGKWILSWILTYYDPYERNLVQSTIQLPTFTLQYAAGEHGTIQGEALQTVSLDGDGHAVTAVPETAYAFVQWSDGSTENPRTDLDVTEDLSVTAIFEEHYLNVNFYTDGTPGVGLEGELMQVVRYGEATSPVTPILPEGVGLLYWTIGEKEFYSWKDTVTVESVTQDATYVALFTTEAPSKVLETVALQSVTTHTITVAWEDLVSNAGAIAVAAGAGSEAPDAFLAMLPPTASDWTYDALAPNQPYSMQFALYNGLGYGERSPLLTVWTLAQTPLAPYVTNPTADSLEIMLDGLDGNPAGTEYAIYLATAGVYVQPDGSLAREAAWQTLDDWGSVICTGLVHDSPYTFGVLARNGAGIVTIMSPYTHAFTNAVGYEAPNRAGASWMLLE